MLEGDAKERLSCQLRGSPAPQARGGVRVAPPWISLACVEGSGRLDLNKSKRDRGIQMGQQIEHDTPSGPPTASFRWDGAR